MNYDLISLIIFFLILFVIFKWKRDKFEVQGKILALYRTKIGIKAMDSLASKFPRFWKIIGFLGILTGFAGMILIFYILINGTYKLITVPSAPPTIAPVLPGVSIPGLPTLSFWHWIIAIFIVATVHEFSHGILARANNVKVKSSGFAFLGPILAAFVEPDEKELSKKKKFAQLSVFAAGPFSNIVLGLIIVLISSITIVPLVASITEYSGVQVVSVEENLPASEAGLQPNDILLEVNNIKVKTTENFTEIMKTTKPNQKITITTTNKTFTLTTKEHPQGKPQGYIGIVTSPVKSGIKEDAKEKYGSFLPALIIWLSRLIFWLYVINLGVGLFNLLPIGPLDGGRMFFVAALGMFKNEKIAKRIFMIITLIGLALIFINLLPFIIKLLKWIIQPFITLFF